MIVTLDGPSGTGKSTVARAVAQALGFAYFDTGAMYRAVTWAVLKQHIDWKDAAHMETFLRDFVFTIKEIHAQKRYFVATQDVTEAIRSFEVTQTVSEVAALPIVRQHLVNIQRRFAQEGNVVFEGRDMGTVVFPKASHKFFLTARPEVRAKRRYQELIQKNPPLQRTLTLQNVLEDLSQRDARDSSRAHSPLRQADDAILVDTSDLSVEQVVAAILAHIKASKK